MNEFEQPVPEDSPEENRDDSESRASRDDWSEREYPGDHPEPEEPVRTESRWKKIIFFSIMAVAAGLSGIVVADIFYINWLGWTSLVLSALGSLFLMVSFITDIIKNLRSRARDRRSEVRESEIVPTASRTERPEIGKPKTKPKNRRYADLVALCFWLAVAVLVSLLSLNWFLKGGLLAIIVILFCNSFVIIPSYHFGVLSVLGRRIRGENGILREGPHLTWPFISSVELVSMELVKKDIRFAFTTHDKLRLQIEGVFQYRPDPDVLDFDERNIFVTVSEEVIVAGVVEAVEARLGGLGGKCNHEVFVENRQALGDIINAILRLQNPPHIDHEVEAGEALVAFYNANWPIIRKILADEKKNLKDRSRIERRYGIDVEAFDLGNVDFTPETQAAFEEEKQAEARAKAADGRLRIASRFKDEVGVSPQTAVDEADLLMDPFIKKTIVSVQGEVGVLSGLIAGVAGGRH